MHDILRLILKLLFQLSKKSIPGEEFYPFPHLLKFQSLIYYFHTVYFAVLSCFQELYWKTLFFWRTRPLLIHSKVSCGFSLFRCRKCAFFHECKSFMVNILFFFMQKSHFEKYSINKADSASFLFKIVIV